MFCSILLEFMPGPGVFSDAVQEFLQQDDHRAVEEEVYPGSRTSA